MSTDMAIALAKKFIRQISQPWDHSQTGISLWTLEDIEAKQRKDQEESERAMQEHGAAFGTTTTGQGSALVLDGPEVDVEMDGFGVDDEVLAAMEMPDEAM
jgi:DNA excision repair protein ERCC-2